MASNLSANYELNSNCISPSLLQSCEYLLFDNFSLATDSGNETVNYCLDTIGNQVKLCFGLADASLVAKNLNKIKNLSNKNLYCLSGNQKEHDELDLYLALNYQNRLVSYDKSGATINGEKVQAPNINLVNTNGAGDALLGAYIALESKLGKLDALMEAVNYASKICSINSPRLI